jgi:tellurite resistance protein
MNIPAPSFKKLYEDFKNQSQSKLNEEQFLSLLIFFPAILVVAADGTIDHEEWFYLNQLVKAMANGFDDDKSVDVGELIENYQADIRFLIRELHTWETVFIPFLKLYLQKNVSAKEDVADVIHMVADASEGISKKEKKVIAQLNESLDLEVNIDE